MNFPWIDLSTSFYNVIRVIVGLGGFFVGYFFSSPFWRVAYWLRNRKSISTTGYLFWLKFLSGVTLGAALYLFLPLGGFGLGGGGSGTGNGTGNGVGPGVDNAPGKGSVGSPTTKTGTATSNRTVLVVELLGGDRYKNDGRYYLIERKEPAVDKAALEELLKRDPNKIEIQLLITRQSISRTEPPARAVHSLASKYQIPVLETVEGGPTP
jgi:hypothetical protein